MNKHKTMRLKKNLITMLVLLGVISLEQIFPDIFQIILGIPAGILAAEFMGTDYTVSSDYVVHIHGHIFDVNVTNACSAGFFFSLLMALLAGMFAVTKRIWLCWLPFFAITMTILINVIRLVCVTYFGVLLGAGMSPEMQMKVHLGLGISVFLPSLIFINYTFERMCFGAKRTTSESDS